MRTRVNLSPSPHPPSPPSPSPFFVRFRIIGKVIGDAIITDTTRSFTRDLRPECSNACQCVSSLRSRMASYKHEQNGPCESSQYRSVKSLCPCPGGARLLATLGHVTALAACKQQSHSNEKVAFAERPPRHHAKESGSLSRANALAQGLKAVGTSCTLSCGRWRFRASPMQPAPHVHAAQAMESIAVARAEDQLIMLNEVCSDGDRNWLQRWCC